MTTTSQIRRSFKSRPH